MQSSSHSADITSSRLWTCLEWHVTLKHPHPALTPFLHLFLHWTWRCLSVLVVTLADVLLLCVGALMSSFKWQPACLLYTTTTEMRLLKGSLLRWCLVEAVSQIIQVFRGFWESRKSIWRYRLVGIPMVTRSYSWLVKHKWQPRKLEEFTQVPL